MTQSSTEELLEQMRALATEMAALRRLVTPCTHEPVTESMFTTSRAHGGDVHRATFRCIDILRVNGADAHTSQRASGQNWSIAACRKCRALYVVDDRELIRMKVEDEADVGDPFRR